MASLSVYRLTPKARNHVHFKVLINQQAPVRRRPRRDQHRRHDPHRRRYVIDVLLPNYVSIVVLIAAVVLFALGFIRWLMLFLVVVCLYSILNAFLAHAYPEQVILAPDSITFVTGKHKSTYKLSQITQIRVREAPQGLRSYVRINKATPLQGRFYLTCGDMTDAQGNDAREVYKLLLDLEAKLDPNGLRVRARRQQQKGE